MLKTCYDEIRNGFPNISLDSFRVVAAVEDYRKYWKPEKVKVVLLAESHVYTSDNEWGFKLQDGYFSLPSYPNNFVKFVYCLGYGENEIINEHIHNNSGTWQYWKILYSCLNGFQNSQNHFSPILKTGTRDVKQRINNKIQLLRDLKKKGVWLIDASIVGINNVKAKKRKQEIILTCWKHYIGNLIKSLRPNHIVCIGRTVSECLDEHLKATKISFSERLQPQARIGANAQMDSLRHYHDVCSKYC